MSQPPSLPDPSLEPAALGRWFTGARREGFLTRLSPEAWHTLCAVLSFTSADNRRSFTIDQLSVALGVPRREAQARFNELADTAWKGLRLLTPVFDSSGNVSGATLAPIEVLSRVREQHAASPTLGTSREDENDEPDDLSQQLSAVGLNSAQITNLRRHFSLAEIRRQLKWLPARGARNPAALLIRAIEQDWDEPKEEA